jgi:threonine/homoserine/homoserine lactone efflux protein
MHAVPVLATIALLWFAAAVAPGPNFLITTRTALLTDRHTGLRTALGIACGASVWGFAGFFGVHALFVLAPWLHLALKLSGSAYLVLIGLKYLLGSFRADAPIGPPREMTGRSALLLGAFTSLANPQTALSTASLFAATLPPQPSIYLGVAAVVVMTVIVFVWYAFVACVLTTRRAAAAFSRMRRWIDRLAGVAFVVFGARLAIER